MEMKLEDSANRIANTRSNAENIITHLKRLIDVQKQEHVSVQLEYEDMYRFPPKKGQRVLISHGHSYQLLIKCTWIMHRKECTI